MVCPCPQGLAGLINGREEMHQQGNKGETKVICIQKWEYMPARTRRGIQGKKRGGFCSGVSSEGATTYTGYFLRDSDSTFCLKILSTIHGCKTVSSGDN